jgi:hypothetical protein
MKRQFATDSTLGKSGQRAARGHPTGAVFVRYWSNTDIDEPAPGGHQENICDQYCGAPAWSIFAKRPDFLMCFTFAKRPDFLR